MLDYPPAYRMRCFPGSGTCRVISARKSSGSKTWKLRLVPPKRSALAALGNRWQSVLSARESTLPCSVTRITRARLNGQRTRYGARRSTPAAPPAARRTVRIDAEARVPPASHLSGDRLGEATLSHEQVEDLLATAHHERLVVDRGEGNERAIGREYAVRHEDGAVHLENGLPREPGEVAPQRSVESEEAEVHRADQRREPDEDHLDAQPRHLAGGQPDTRGRARVDEGDGRLHAEFPRHADEASLKIETAGGVADEFYIDEISITDAVPPIELMAGTWSWDDLP